MLHEYFHDAASPGTSSKAFITGNELQKSEHSGVYDRNPLAYAMLEIKLSMNGHGLDTLDYSTIAMYDQVCGGGEAQLGKYISGGPAGWRVAVPKPDHGTYTQQIKPTDFAPVVAFGPLEMLQSMRLTQLQLCEDDFGQGDAMKHFACSTADRGGVSSDLEHRAKYAPFAMQRSVWCNAGKTLSIEQSVGNPFFFDHPLYDSNVDDPNLASNMIVPKELRGEENLDESYRSRNLFAWVYVTSSSDANVRSGMHRLLDLPVFRQEKCNDLPSVVCNPRTGHVINTDRALTDSAPTPFIIGRYALTKHRCSRLVTQETTFTCHERVYSGTVGCTSDSLALDSQNTVYGAKHFLDSLKLKPSPSPPPGPPPPNPPPSPKPPHPPPLPPVVVSQLEALKQVRVFEERACTSVYYLSQATRCERLAIDLTNMVLYSKLAPPLAPPVLPEAPPPPPLPPLPDIPDGMALQDADSVVLSTNRMPTYTTDTQLYDGYFSNDGTLNATVSLLAPGRRACLSLAPLPCVSGITKCLGSHRNCRSDQENALNPYLHMYWRPLPRQYLWGLRLTLPRTTQLAELFVGKKTIEVFGDRDEPLPCVHGNDEVYALPTGNTVDVVCVPIDWTEETLQRLSRAQHIKLTLRGEYRQIWLASIQLLKRSYKLADIVDAPPPPPSPPFPPPLPPLPLSPAATAFTFASRRMLPLSLILENKDEPCAQSQQQCADRTAELALRAFTLDDAGCCAPLVVDGGVNVASSLISRFAYGFVSVHSGTGYL